MRILINGAYQGSLTCDDGYMQHHPRRLDRRIDCATFSGWKRTKQVLLSTYYSRILSNSILYPLTTPTKL